MDLVTELKKVPELEGLEVSSSFFFFFFLF